MKKCIVKGDLAANGKVGIDNKYEKDSFVTTFNGTTEEVYEYYKIGKTFNMGLWYDSEGNEHEDSLMHITNVFALEDCELTQEFIEFLGVKYYYDWADHFCKEEYEKFCA